MKKILLLLIASFFLAGCGLGRLSRLAPLYDLPVQSLHARHQEGKTRVIFYNTTPPPTSIVAIDKIDIVLDNRNVGSIRAREYIIVDLEPKEYSLKLTHYDVFKFSSTYKLKVSGKDMFVKVYNGAVSTKYKLAEELSDNFENWFKPAYKGY